MTTTGSRLLILLAIAVLGLTPAVAEQGDSKIRFGAQWLDPTGDYVERDPAEEFAIEADAAVGGFFEYEYMLRDKVGLFGNISFQNHDVEAELTEFGPPVVTTEATIGDVDVLPVEFGVNFYVVQKESVAFFLGPKVAYVSFGDVELNPAFLDPGDPTEIPTDDSFGYGANFGVEVAFGESGWSFFGGLQYMVFSLETDDGVDSVEVDIDPIVARVGVGKKF